MLAGLLAYCTGIVLTDAALALELFGSQGQPALMYLVPCALGTTWLLAYMRSDCMALWTGRVDEWKDHASGSDDVDVEQQEGALGAQAAERRGSTANGLAAGASGGARSGEAERLLPSRAVAAQSMPFDTQQF
jgi:signal peptide peptidase-like 2B